MYLLFPSSDLSYADGIQHYLTTGLPVGGVSPSGTRYAVRADSADATVRSAAL
jgi:hypothetical protein